MTVEYEMLSLTTKIFNFILEIYKMDRYLHEKSLEILKTYFTSGKLQSLEKKKNLLKIQFVDQFVRSVCKTQKLLDKLT